MTKNLTAASVERFKPDPKRRREIPDGFMRSLYLIVQPGGAKSWCLRYRHNGASRKLTIGPYPAFGLVEAREEAQAALLRAQRGGDPAREKKIAKALAQRRTEISSDDFEGVSREFFKRHAIGRDPSKPNNRSWRKVARLLGFDGTLAVVKGGLVEQWRERKIGDIGRADIRVLLAETSDRAPFTANRLLANLRRLFAWAVENDLLTVNPCAGIKPPAKETSRDRVLSGAEIVKFWRATEGGDPFDRIMRLCLLTGCRLNEVAGMTRDELSEDGLTWSIPGARTKNKKPHMVPLSALARDVIAGATPVGNLVFTFTGRPVGGWTKVGHRLAAAMKVEGWRRHDLRRTCATGMIDLGIPPHVVEACLNHISGARAGVAGVYNRSTYLPEKKAAFERWAAHVASLVEGKPSKNVVPLRA